MDQFSYSFFLLPAALFVSGALIKYLAPDAEGQGTDRVIEAVHKRAGKMNGRVIPVKIVATIITIAFGGSAGRIGPCAQIGGALSSLFADLLRFDDRDRKKLVICGISAGFASVLGTPIAGAIFGVEVLFVGSILYDVGQKGLFHFYFGKYFRLRGDERSALLHFRTALDSLERGSPEREEAQREIKALTAPPA